MPSVDDFKASHHTLMVVLDSATDVDSVTSGAFASAVRCSGSERRASASVKYTGTSVRRSSWPAGAAGG